MFDHNLLEAIRRHAHVLTHDSYDSVVEGIGDAQVVMLGEATHGTREFYRARALITRRLVREKGFNAVAVEADWPDALRVSRFVLGRDGPGGDGRTALGDFRRFPRWMWRNPEVLAFVNWLRQHNAAQRHGVGFYGLDLYSLRASMEAVVQYLADVDPAAEQRARHRYACFDHAHDDPQSYAYKARLGLARSCEDDVVAQMLELQRASAGYLQAGSVHDGDELFYAQQNARVARNAEAYYRSMFGDRHDAWNLRDTHMMETLEALRTHLESAQGTPAKVVVWAHNSHIGDASATELGREGELNLGQLARERLGINRVALVGFTTHTGTVTAASSWGGTASAKTVAPSLPDSFERLFHDSGIGDFVLDANGLEMVFDDIERLQRAIGVIYLPETERLSHYFSSRIARQFDMVVHLDQTSALQPLDAGTACPDLDETPETYPSGV
jgi:erythromycin esterase-like protein